VDEISKYEPILFWIGMLSEINYIDGNSDAIGYGYFHAVKISIRLFCSMKSLQNLVIQKIMWESCLGGASQWEWGTDACE
jgi:hypothetical protein